MIRAVLLAQLLQRQERSRLAYFVSNAIILPLAMASVGERMFHADTRLAASWMIGSAFFGAALGSVTQVGFSTMFDRLRGRVRLLQVSGVRRRDYFACYVLVAAGWALLLALGAMGGFAALGAVAPSWQLFATTSMAAVLIGIFYGALGAAIGTNAHSIEAGTGTLIVFGTLGGLLSPALYSAATLPPFVGSVLRFIPLALAADLGKSIAAHQAFSWPNAIALLVTVVFGTVLSYWFVRWGE